MFGNCATGKLRTVSEPTSTSTMEITMATIGRLMKNFDIALPALRIAGKRLGIHLRALPNFLYALGNDHFARFKPFGDHPLRTALRAELYRANFHFVFAVHDGNLVSTLQLGNGPLRYQQRVGLCLENEANFAVATRP